MTNTNRVTHTVTVETQVGEREVWMAVEAAQAAGATHYAIRAPRPAGGYYVAARGPVARPMLTQAQVSAMSGR